MSGKSDGSSSSEEEERAPPPLASNWQKGKANEDSRINIWSLNGFGEPVLTGGKYKPDEAKVLEQTVKDYCASKNVEITELIDTAHNKNVRGAWKEIAQCLLHRTILSVYRRAQRQFHGMTRGKWSQEETASLINLVDLHGHKWKVIQDKLGRSATDCREKYFGLNSTFQKGRWSKESVELLLKSVRISLSVTRSNMDIREINRYTLEHNKKIPWTVISCKVNRKRQDCYFKWKQMTRRSNKKAIRLGLEPIPMSRESVKFDVRSEYYKWKAEKVDSQYQQESSMSGVSSNNLNEQDVHLLNSIIESKATRPSQFSFIQRGVNLKKRWEELVDEYANDDDLDLPLWKLAKRVKDVASQSKPDTTTSNNELQNQSGKSIGKKRKRKDMKVSSSRRIAQLESLGALVPMEQLHQSIKNIVETDRDDITVKRVRNLLEEKYKVDLSPYKKIIKEIVIDAV